MVLNHTVWDMLEQWSPKSFLAAGGLFALPAVASGLHVVIGTEIAMSPAVIFMFMLVVFIGLLGLYPRLAKQDSTLATGGVGLLAVTTAILIPATAAFMFSTGPPFGRATALAIVVTVAVGSALTVMTFGIASLRNGAHPRPIGGFLLVMAVGVAVIIVAMLVYGHSTPAWMEFVANGLVATALGSIGSVLRTADIPTESPDATGDATAS